MTSERMFEWLDAVEYLMTGNPGGHVENDCGYSVVIGGTAEGRYEKFNQCLEFCGAVDSAAEAVLWLYENNNSYDEV